jgi:single-strand DNA-binding protein
MSINATIFGRMGADPETRDAGSSTVTSIRIASDHGFGDRKTTTWVSVSIWGKRGQWVSDNMRKGERVVASGMMQHRTWTKKDGSDAISLELDATQVDRVDWPARDATEAPQPRAYASAPKAPASVIDPNDPNAMPF